MKRAYYSDKITSFIQRATAEVLGELAMAGSVDGTSVEATQLEAWREQIEILKVVLSPYSDRGSVYFEYSIPRLGRRIDVLAVIGPVLFVLEFKVGEDQFKAYAMDQAYDYGLDLKNFHETSHAPPIAPIVIPTGAEDAVATIAYTNHADGVMMPIQATSGSLGQVMQRVLDVVKGESIDIAAWEQGRYHPTPTIVEAAMALYNGHSVDDIVRKDASAKNLSATSQAISQIIQTSRDRRVKSICFVTGVPGAGKTLVGLNVATDHIDKKNELYSVFLSGNGPLVDVLREALTRDKVRHEKESGRKAKKGAVLSEVKMFIQNVHHFRDDFLKDKDRPPIEHVAIFDEAQRAWTLEQTRKFMLQRKKAVDFNHSEPEFLISCLNRHDDWATIVCLVGGGQEINTGEAGISEWINALNRLFPDWRIYLSSRLTDSEYGAGQVLQQVSARPNVILRDELHLGVSMRSFRAENVSLLVKQLLDLDESAARDTLGQISDKYPIVISRDLTAAKQWVKDKARGTEHYGLVASSEAQRLKPHAIDVRSPIDHVHWFLDGKQDVRSSYYLEDVATEFQVQGLELDWTCVTWDGDFRYTPNGWENWSFCGDRWNRIRKTERQVYQKNAYRVLLTRARQGMVIVVPDGNASDPTRDRGFYDPTFEYLTRIGFTVI